MSMSNERWKLSVGTFFSSSAKDFLKQYESNDGFAERRTVWQDVLAEAHKGWNEGTGCGLWAGSV